MLRYILAHWRGEQSLAQSYWINTLLLTFAVYLGFLLLEAPLSRLPIRTILTLSYALVVVLSALTVWQLVGLWRSAGNTMARTGRRLWPVVAMVLVVLSVVAGVLNVSVIMNDLRKVSSALNDPGLADYSVERLPGVGVLLTGAINDDSAGETMAALDAADVAVLKIESHGGLTEPAVRLARYLRDNDVTVLAESQCMSACVWMLAASARATIHPWTVVTFHRTEPIADFDTPELRQETDRYAEDTLTYDRELGIPAWVVRKVQREEYWTPTIQEQIDIGLIGYIYDPEASAVVLASEYCAAHQETCGGQIDSN